MHFMVKVVQDSIQRECVQQLYKGELFGALLDEAGDVQGARRSAEERLEALRRVLQVTERMQHAET
eukprot:NODE_28052_length_491_cov_1.978022.p3 GENE.NODE_28052_length_491_cov_1.978022~~NODE_28052_length_491_cov_1.978022.p3  ORF type:complete len:66 (-),score=30.83 NODE_28052_length_491_cov_1.978022:178-375(-)